VAIGFNCKFPYFPGMWFGLKTLAIASNRHGFITATSLCKFIRSGNTSGIQNKHRFIVACVAYRHGFRVLCL